MRSRNENAKRAPANDALDPTDIENAKDLTQAALAWARRATPASPGKPRRRSAVPWLDLAVVTLALDPRGLARTAGARVTPGLAAVRAFPGSAPGAPDAASLRLLFPVI